MAAAGGVFVLSFLIVMSSAPAVFLDEFQSNRNLQRTIVIRPPHPGGDRHTMFLPLFLSHPNYSAVSSSRSYDGNRRRHLQRSGGDFRPNAQMDLHDDLLLNGYYTAWLWIGTPPQKFALIIDTGSTVTYVPCSTCEQCGKHQDPKFQPDLSSTYQPVKCNIDCTCDRDRVQCVYERSYAEMSSSSGVLGEDIISFGSQSELKPQRAMFGCENVETGDLYSQHADGIMGLGRGDLSIVDQLVGKGVISDSFSLCYGGMDIGGGTMVLGGISPPKDMVFARSDPGRSPYYNIDLKEIHVAGKALPLSSRVFDGKHGTVLDSGTTYAYLPEAAFTAFKEAIMTEIQSLKQIRGPDPNYNDICFSGAGSDISELPKIFPSVDMVFGNRQKLSLSPENYLFRHSKVRGAYCLGIFQNGDATTLLGGIIVRNTLATYDREHEKIGFWKTNCSELWKRLQTSDISPSAPSISNGTNSTAGMTPSLAPAGTAPSLAPSGTPPSLAPSGKPPSLAPTHNVPPVGMKVGKITFYMSSSVNNSELKPRISELSHSIAQQLGVNVDQIHLLNFTSNGNSSLMRWAILPAGSSNSFANATAIDIISRLQKHRVQLSKDFGNYELFNWNTEPPHQRTWWQQHYLYVVVAIVVMVIVALSASGAWFIWRNRQQSVIPYKPVDSAVPEQELQPLQSGSI